MTTIDNLANETLIKIMEMLKKPSPHSRDNYENAPGRYTALRAAALVCRRWRDPAQRALFQNAEFSNSFPLRPERFLASPVQLRLHTRSLSVTSAKHSDFWPDISEACRNLRRLKLAVFYLNLGARERPSFAGLKHLTISIEDAIYAPGRGVHLPMRLSSLALWANTGMPFLSAAFSSSLETFEKLHLSDPMFLGGFDGRRSSTLNVVGLRLRTLILDTDSRNSLEENLHVFPALTALESFSWINSKGESLRATDVRTLQSILDAFPSPATLRHLSIGTNELSSLEHVIPLIQHPTLALLTKLEFPRFPTTPTAWLPPVAGELAQACETRGIRMSIGPSKSSTFRYMGSRR